MRRGEDVADVYADWLMERGHPRGRLIAVQRALRERPEDAALREEEVWLLGELWEPLVGIDIEWRDGFVERARVTNGYDLDRVLRDPSARMVRELVVEDTTAVAFVMRAWPPPPLRRLVLGSDETDWPVSVSDVGARYPDLEELELRGRAVEVGELYVPKLRVLRVDAMSLSARTIQSIVGATWPALRALRVHQTPGCTAFVRALTRSPLARVIDELALGRLVDGDAEMLVLHRAAFVQLVRSRFSGDTSDGLREAFPT